MRRVLLGVTFALTASIALPVAADHTCTISATDAGGPLPGTDGDDVICGGPGADLIDAGGGDDVILPGPGADTVAGGSGTDTVTYEHADAGVRLDLQAASPGPTSEDGLVDVERLTGSAHHDVLGGDAGSNELRGRDGTDLLFGRGGVDRLEGGDGEDHLRADPGSEVDGGPGSDVCVGPGVSCSAPSPADPDDAGGFLDVRQVRTRFTGDRAEFSVDVRSWVKRRRMWDSGYVLVHFDTTGDASFDYYAMVRATRRGFRAALWRDDRYLRRLAMWRTSRSNFSFAVGLPSMTRGPERAHFRWRALTMTDRCRGWCMDRVANEGGLVQPYPGVA